MNYEKVEVVTKKDRINEQIKQNPHMLQIAIEEWKKNLVINTEYFFKQADIIALLDLLDSREVKSKINGNKELEKSIKALSRFRLAFSDYRFEMERFNKIKREINN